MAGIKGRTRVVLRVEAESSAENYHGQNIFPRFMWFLNRCAAQPLY